jgi:hypothetical protein
MFIHSSIPQMKDAWLIAARRRTMKYQIKIAGMLDQSWFDWLGDVSFANERAEDGSITTTLTVDATDQPMLFGILDHIRDMNMPLLAVTKMDNEFGNNLPEEK